MKVALLNPGYGNLFSMSRFLSRLSIDFDIASTYSNREQEALYDAIIVPGIGHFGSGIRRLKSSNLDRFIEDEFARGTLIVGICLGFQLLCRRSEEEPEIEGLGLVPFEVVSNRNLGLTKSVNNGWDFLKSSKNFDLENNEDIGPVYFSNSYGVSVELVKTMPNVEYLYKSNSSLIGYIKHGNVIGIQFHPEKSRDFGENLFTKTLRSH